LPQSEPLRQALRVRPVDSVNEPTSDRDVERLFVESRLGRFGQRVARAARASWLDSQCRVWAVATVSGWQSLDVAGALRAAGWTVAVAAATTLIVQGFGGGRQEPTTRVLPVVAAAGGLVLQWLASRRSNPDGRQGS
jgi:hypothetical protein